MDNVNRAVLSPRPAPAAGRGARWSRRITATLARAAAVCPTRAQVLLPWSALRAQPRLLLPGLLVLVALIGIVTALEQTTRLQTPVRAIGEAGDLGRTLPPIPGFVRGMSLRNTAIDRVYTRPGVSLRSVRAQVWARAAFGLPDPQPGLPLGAYTDSAIRLSWFCVALTLLALAFLPAAVAGTRIGLGSAPEAAGPWLRWRIVTAPFWLLGLGLLPFVGLAVAAEVPWWVLSLPVARWIALTMLAAAVAVAVGCRARSSSRLMLAGHALSLAAALPVTLAVTALVRWLTGWSAVLPDPEIAGWIEGGLKPALWLLVAGAGTTLVLGGLAAPWEAVRRAEPQARAPRARLILRVGRGLATAGRLVAGLALFGVVLFGARFAVRTLQGDGGPNDIQWSEPVTRRQIGQATTAPSGLRGAFREFGAGTYESVVGMERRLPADAVTTDDRRLLEAAAALAQGEDRQVREVTGAFRSQYAAALIARAAAALRAGKAAAADPAPGALWSLVAAHSDEALAPADEAAGLERLIAGLDEAQYLVYSPRRALFLRIPYKLFERPGAVALRIAMLRRLVALRPNEDGARVQLAQTLAGHERLLTDSSIREVQMGAQTDLRGQQETLCHEALALNPRNWEALVVLGRLDDAIALRPQNTKLRQLRIDHAHESGDMTHLREDARQLVALTSSDAARYTLAMAHVSTGAVATGIQELSRLLEHATARAGAGDSLPAEFPAWSVNAAMLLAQTGRFAEARATLERTEAAGALDGKAPLEPRTLLALLRLEAGDRAGARELLDSRPPDRPFGGMLPVMADLRLRESVTQRTLRRVNVPSGALGFAPRFYAWKDEGVAFDLEPIARAIVRRDPHSLAGRYLLADALASRQEPRPIDQPPTPLTLEALRLLHGLTREYPGWIAPLECLSSLSLRLGHFDRAAGYQRIVGELYGDADRGRWLWRSPGYGGPQLGRPGGGFSGGFSGPQPGQQGFLR
jgi:hypothetical protein